MTKRLNYFMFSDCVNRKFEPFLFYAERMMIDFRPKKRWRRGLFLDGEDLRRGLFSDGKDLRRGLFSDGEDLRRGLFSDGKDLRRGLFSDGKDGTKVIDLASDCRRLLAIFSHFPTTE